MMYGARRQFDFPIGPVQGAAGTTQTITISPQMRFRVEKVMAVDDPPGSVLLMQFLVGQQLQRPNVGGGSLAAFFGPFALANGVCWGTCEPALKIAITVSFVQDATFYGSLFGTAII